MGGMNYHVELRFDDGICWMARIRRNHVKLSPPIDRDHDIKSEVATLRFLEKTKIPAPKVFDFALKGKDNPVGVGYILMEKMPGRAVDWSMASAEGKRKLVPQLAKILIELQSHPLESMGSLDLIDTLSLGAFTLEPTISLEGSNMHLIGPCGTARDYYEQFVCRQLDFIVEGERLTDRPVDAYLVYQYLLDSIPAVFSSPSDNGPFYLKHADDKGDQILADDEYNITGIIDWQWAYTTSANSAFVSPLALISPNHFYTGSLSLSDEEALLAQSLEDEGQSQMASAVRIGRTRQLFDYCCIGDLADWEGFIGLFKGLRQALKSGEDLSWDEWKKIALQRYQRDSQLQLLLSQEHSRGQCRPKQD
ncbi:MAG: hypothetical protein M1819_004861 [Sarea resinae]|nr:MAG: hypothetical protein M1819_004861 [Sarea resinae]